MCNPRCVGAPKLTHAFTYCYSWLLYMTVRVPGSVTAVLEVSYWCVGSVEAFMRMEGLFQVKIDVCPLIYPEIVQQGFDVYHTRKGGEQKFRVSFFLAQCSFITVSLWITLSWTLTCATTSFQVLLSSSVPSTLPEVCIKRGWVTSDSSSLFYKNLCVLIAKLFQNYVHWHNCEAWTAHALQYIIVSNSSQNSLCKRQGQKSILKACNLWTLRQHCIKNRCDSVMEIPAWS